MRTPDRPAPSTIRLRQRTELRNHHVLRRIDPDILPVNSDRLKRVQIRISTGGASAPKLARNADTQGLLSSKATYIGVLQQPAIIRRVFEAAVSLIA